MDVTNSTNTLSPGDTLQSYNINALLGHGGFGVTYLALDTRLDMQVAIKEYLPSHIVVRAPDNSVQQKSNIHSEAFHWGLTRFIKEAQTLGRFRHPNIVRVLTVFEENQTAYMVMDYERGQNLKAAVRHPAFRTEANLKFTVGPVIDGLSEVHSRGYIHRDIKPANLLIRDDSTPVLLDFGSARQTAGIETQALTSMITVGYAPLEQYCDLTSEQQGPWTDIYGLAAVLYFAITGSPPVESTMRGSALLNDRPDPMASLVGLMPRGYSRQFLEAIDWALSFKVSDRPQSLAEWRAKLLTDESDQTFQAPSIVGAANAEVSGDSLEIHSFDSLSEAAQYLNLDARLMSTEGPTKLYDPSAVHKSSAQQEIDIDIPDLSDTLMSDTLMSDTLMSDTLMLETLDTEGVYHEPIDFEAEWDVPGIDEDDVGKECKLSFIEKRGWDWFLMPIVCIGVAAFAWHVQKGKLDVQVPSKLEPSEIAQTAEATRLLEIAKLSAGTEAAKAVDNPESIDVVTFASFADLGDVAIDNDVAAEAAEAAEAAALADLAAAAAEQAEAAEIAETVAAREIADAIAAAKTAEAVAAAEKELEAALKAAEAESTEKVSDLIIAIKKNLDSLQLTWPIPDNANDQLNELARLSPGHDFVEEGRQRLRDLFGVWIEKQVRETRFERAHKYLRLLSLVENSDADVQRFEVFIANAMGEDLPQNTDSSGAATDESSYLRVQASTEQAQAIDIDFGSECDTADWLERPQGRGFVTRATRRTKRVGIDMPFGALNSVNLDEGSFIAYAELSNSEIKEYAFTQRLYDAEGSLMLERLSRINSSDMSIDRTIWLSYAAIYADVAGEWTYIVCEGGGLQVVKKFNTERN